MQPPGVAVAWKLKGCPAVPADGTVAVHARVHEPLVNVNRSAAVVGLVPPGVVTVTCTAPAACGGLTALTEESEATVKLAAAVSPKVTAVAPVNPAPRRPTGVPPEMGPEFGETWLTVGPDPVPAYVNPAGRVPL